MSPTTRCFNGTQTEAMTRPGFCDGADPNARTVSVLGGNQRDGVSVASVQVMDVLGIRRLVEEEAGHG